MDRITDGAHTEEAVEYFQLLLRQLQQTPDGLMVATHLMVFQSGHLLYARSHLQTALGISTNQIDAYQRILKIPVAQCIHFYVVKELATSLISRLMLFKVRNDAK
jgi:hypothetical protein